VRIEEFEGIFRPPRPSAGPHTLDAPIRYEVWRSYALGRPADPVDLLLESTELGSATAIKAIRGSLTRLDVDLGVARPATLDELIVIKLDFDALLEVIVPLTSWQNIIEVGRHLSVAAIQQQLREALKAEEDGASATDRTLPLPPTLMAERFARNPQDLLDRFRWFSLLAVRIGYVDRPARTDTAQALFAPSTVAGRNAATWLKRRFTRAGQPEPPVKVASVSMNRAATFAVQRSRNTIKADAAIRLFALDSAGLGWAVLDSGIDARHPAFRMLDPAGRPHSKMAELTPKDVVSFTNNTRIVATYDLTQARERFAGLGSGESLLQRVQDEFTINLYPENVYLPPANDHGTHVAGILAANWLEEVKTEDGLVEWKPKLLGVCPDLRLWDIRVLDDTGRGDEFSVIAGLRLVQEINRKAGRLVIHGVNLSMSMPHHVANYACGWTPVCNACTDLVDSGVVVVTAAGNTGFTDAAGNRRADGTNYNDISITDPGNAEKVITVGATHATLPHRYGPSYFSARGPTADGRRKPDLLAPGEGITGPIPLVHDTEAEYKSYDGTSQAAPHVSGAAALLLARYPELRGQPERVKQLLCGSSTDLGREAYFQGHGLVDVLRALQSH
jgi:subtilisin family serine protease